MTNHPIWLGSRPPHGTLPGPGTAGSSAAPAFASMISSAGASVAVVRDAS